jgi:hypothetical protein
LSFLLIHHSFLYFPYSCGLFLWPIRFRPESDFKRQASVGLFGTCCCPYESRWPLAFPIVQIKLEFREGGGDLSVSPSSCCCVVLSRKRLNTRCASTRYTLFQHALKILVRTVLYHFRVTPAIQFSGNPAIEAVQKVTKANCQQEQRNHLPLPANHRLSRRINSN